MTTSALMNQALGDGLAEAIHPREALLGAQGGFGFLPVCDHYSGVEARMRKSLDLQLQMHHEFGAWVFDVTLDCEDGAPAGGEADQARLVAELANEAAKKASLAGLASTRVGVRLHAVDHYSFAQDAELVVSLAAKNLSYVMIPKVESVGDVDTAVLAVDKAAEMAGLQSNIPIHVLVESPAAVHRAFDIAAHPRVESISFGLMDFVSAHGGAIGSQAMGVRHADDRETLDQFHHPLVLRAKMEIASACHAHRKAPSHCVVTEFKDSAALERSARQAREALGYTRMWSIHPDQIRPILKAFSPAHTEVEMAARIIEKALANEWAPLSFAGTLHDRASYRYFWQLLERAHQTGVQVPQAMQHFFNPAV